MAQDPRADREKGAPLQTDGLWTGDPLVALRGPLVMLERSLRAVNSQWKSKFNFPTGRYFDSK